MIRRVVLLTINAGLLGYLGTSIASTPRTPPDAIAGNSRAYTAPPLPDPEPAVLEDGSLDLFRRTLPQAIEHGATVDDEAQIRLLGIVWGAGRAVALIELEEDRTIVRVAEGNYIGKRRITAVSERAITLRYAGKVETIHLDPETQPPQ